ncbi:hypothetical protein [Myxococcus faecalis]|uniref:hypothetical protein n=1 Tax=Myxococcus faecalis TaxID=3115646 RepID=UPI003CEFB03B
MLKKCGVPPRTSTNCAANWKEGSSPSVPFIAQGAAVANTLNSLLTPASKQA